MWKEGAGGALPKKPLPTDATTTTTTKAIFA